MASSGTRAWGRLKGLARQRRGQAVVETMFALTVVVLIILVIAQLFVISDLAMGVMGAAHYQGTREARALDNAQTFRYVQTGYARAVSALPGMEMALRHFDEGGTASSYNVERRVQVAAGAFIGQDISRFAVDGDFMGRGHSGIRYFTMTGYVGY